MRILHTSDWHLGQKFIGRSREVEHKLFLEWLIDQVETLKPDILLVSGDIFDVHNPPVYCENLYYGFLGKMMRSPCKHIIVTAGNHDSIFRIEAPRNVLQFIDVTVVGQAPGNPADVLHTISDTDGKPLAIIAAVPYLREKDLGAGKAGETFAERILRIQAGIKGYYDDCAAALDTDFIKKNKVPVIAMGHLFATGASAGEEQNNIYVGNLQNIRAEDFSSAFDYVALGHIHRPQIVGKKEHIRYCGSPIPLSFSEVKDQKLVLAIDFADKKIAEITKLEVPVFRKISRVKGNLEAVQTKLQALGAIEAPLPAWAEVIVESDQRLPDFNHQLQALIEDMPIEVLKWQNIYPGKSLNEQVEVVRLADMTPEEVFMQKLELESLEKETADELVLQFQELLNKVRVGE